jgi:hypothetical protein
MEKAKLIHALNTSGKYYFEKGNESAYGLKLSALSQSTETNRQRNR